MSSKAMSLKGRINNYARKNNIAAQVVLQNYMFERFLDRLSRSAYQEKFVIKGGMLVAAIVGLDIRDEDCIPEPLACIMSVVSKARFSMPGTLSAEPYVIDPFRLMPCCIGNTVSPMSAKRYADIL